MGCDVSFKFCPTRLKINVVYLCLQETYVYGDDYSDTWDNYDQPYSEDGYME